MFRQGPHPLVYHVRKARSTGSEAQVIDNREVERDRKWILRCLTHSLDVDGEARLKAEARAHHPEAWCNKCAAALKRAESKRLRRRTRAEEARRRANARGPAKKERPRLPRAVGTREAA